MATDTTWTRFGSTIYIAGEAIVLESIDDAKAIVLLHNAVARKLESEITRLENENHRLHESLQKALADVTESNQRIDEILKKY